MAKVELNHGRNSHAYKKLVIVTPSHMQGLLAKHLDSHINDLIVNQIQKDVMSLPEHELLTFIKNNLLPD